MRKQLISARIVTYTCSIVYTVLYLSCSYTRLHNIVGCFVINAFALILQLKSIHNFWIRQINVICRITSLAEIIRYRNYILNSLLWPWFGLNSSYQRINPFFNKQNKSTWPFFFFLIWANKNACKPFARKINIDAKSMSSWTHRSRSKYFLLIICGVLALR